MLIVIFYSFQVILCTEFLSSPQNSCLFFLIFCACFLSIFSLFLCNSFLPCNCVHISSLQCLFSLCFSYSFPFIIIFILSFLFFHFFSCLRFLSSPFLFFFFLFCSFFLFPLFSVLFFFFMLYLFILPFFPFFFQTEVGSDDNCIDNQLKKCVQISY